MKIVVESAIGTGDAVEVDAATKGIIKRILNDKPHGVHRRDLIHWTSHMLGFSHDELASAARAVRATLVGMEAEGFLLEDVTGRVYLRGQEAWLEP